ncbi:arginine--tRNA ligase, partial [Patescibacteria group bacterium]|nr:arginine--tRNA ligase [Patescibacteria group bacterium]MBU1987714.1 arginine--tRNA ligase [Patescibacteria group bacterium]
PKTAPPQFAAANWGGAVFGHRMSFSVVGPYLNFNINKEYLAQNVINKISKLKNKYGLNKNGKEKKVMIEYSNANTHKEYHIGHLRNICYGDAVNKILSANGYDIIPVSYINDFGSHVAKTLWNCSLRIRNQESGIRNLSDAQKGVILGEIYVDATKKVENNQKAKQEIALFMKKIKSRQGAEYELWKKTRNWSMAYFNKIYDELGIKFKKTFYESEFINDGLKLVDKLLEKKVLKKSKGAVIADLEKYNLGILVCLRSDKTALYPVADIPLAIEKFGKYSLDTSIYVVDIRQSLYLKQLSKILELMGYKQEVMHLGYDVVKLPTGMMSSRTGNVITYEDLKKQILQKAEQETAQKHPDWNKLKIKKTAKKIGFGAMKFEMIKVSANQVIIFDIEKSLRFDGYTSAYLQYTYVRINSIIRKSEIRNSKFEIRNLRLKEIKEYKIIIKLAKYMEVIEKAGENYDPSEIAKYLFELAQLFNDYYHSVQVLKAEAKTRDARLVLLFSVSQIIKNGLELLGIEVMEEM